MNESERLTSSVGDCIKCTNTIKFVHKREVTSNRMKDVTYGQFFVKHTSQKAKKNQTRFVVGGNHINYIGKFVTPTAKMLVAKLLFNGVISTKSARFMMIDISNFYLMMPLARPKCTRIKLSGIPNEIIKEYNLTGIRVWAYIYVHFLMSFIEGLLYT